MFIRCVRCGNYRPVSDKDDDARVAPCRCPAVEHVGIEACISPREIEREVHAFRIAEAAALQ